MASSRSAARPFIWVALGICVLIDSALADYAISPSYCLILLDDFGNVVFPKPSPDAWILVTAFVLIQSLLILALIRTRKATQVFTHIFGDSQVGSKT